jgi:hypothetical protein
MIFFVQVRVDFVDTSLLPPAGGICLDQQLTGVQKNLHMIYSQKLP